MSRSSFAGLSRLVPRVTRIEVPILQRDYAQGRPGAGRIRDAFVDALHAALTTRTAIHLDFVYGEIVADKLVPLDGQQRLTALFLLHWYLAARAGVAVEETSSLPVLTYETRHSSRVFCDRLLRERPAFPLPSGWAVSEWLRDRSWFVRAWRHDPTIESMLVVIDAIHTRFASDDCAAAWAGLVDIERPLITFDFLSIHDLGLTDELYIRMNSRGRPLTAFESFKAQLEELLCAASPDLAASIARRIDGEWTETFWRLRDKTNAIDDAFLAYLGFVTEIVGHRAGRPMRSADTLLERVKSIVAGAADADANIASLAKAFDVWTGRGVRQLFDLHFTRDSLDPERVALFDDVQLFDECCRTYSRGFELARSLLLAAVLHHLAGETTEFPDRIRVIRNLVLNSANELRADTLPTVLAGVDRIVDDGARAEVSGFNRRQMEEERRKADVVERSPAIGRSMRRLENHPLLRGCLAAFDLGSEHFQARAATFEELFAGPAGVRTIPCERPSSRAATTLGASTRGDSSSAPTAARTGAIC